MKSKRILTVMLTGALALGFGTALVTAQEEQTEPATGVARVSLINGNVATKRGDSGDWVATTVNAPLVPGDSISTNDRSRTEVQLDYANVLRLDQNSEAKIADLTRSRIQVQLAQGMMDFSVFKGTQADVEIDMPNIAVQPTGPGTFRIQVTSQGETQVIVRDGEAQVSTPQGSTTVKEGDLITVEGTDNPQYQVTRAPARDAWDDWNHDRNNVILNAQSYTHTNHYYTGSQDLDRYGHWAYVPDYGWAWSPYEDAGWVPYRDGRWVWEPGWGWTWVSYEPWGWAPYHYGRWFSSGASWFWWPGFATPFFRPVFAPAFVSFIGFGFGSQHFFFGSGFGFASIGWLPLGPFDPFFPWWGFGNSFNVVNITNITNITNVTNVRNGRLGSNFNSAFTNARVRGALTTVSTQDFVSGRVPRRVQSVNVNQLRQGSVIKGTLPVVPTRQSLSPANRPAVVPAVAHTGAGQRSFFTRNQPPAGPQPFAQRAAEIQQMVRQRNTLEAAKPGLAAQGHSNAMAGRPMQTSPAPAAASVNARTASQAAVGAQTAGRPAPNSGWRSFGGRAPAATDGPAATNLSRAPGPSGQQRTGQSAPLESSQARRPGWQRFGNSSAPAATPSPAVGNRFPRQGETSSQPAASSSGREAASPGWRRFGSPDSRQAPSREQAAPRGNQPATREAPKTAPRSEPAIRNDNPPRSSNWREFTPQPQPRSASSGAEPARSGWNRFPSSEPAPRNERMNFPSRSEAPAYSRGSAPGSYQRPPLEIRKPIVDERAPRSFVGSPSGGSWGSRGGGGSWGGSRAGGGRSAPAPSSRGGGGSRNRQ